MKLADPIGRECDVFVRYLTSSASTPYLRRKYADAIATLQIAQEPGEFEAALLNLARRSPRATRIADSYSALFAPKSVLRARLVLTLALVESAPSHYERMDRPPAGPVRELTGAMVSAAGGIVSLLIGTLVLLPVQLLHKARS